MPTATDASRPEDVQRRAQLAAMALANIRREYPNQISHVLRSEEDVAAPHKLTPAFYGCYDWHSAVHSHWSLARLARLFPDDPWSSDACQALDVSLTPANIAGEVAYLAVPERAGFERPYGLAWLLQLDAELAKWGPRGVHWREAIQPLASLAAQRFESWLPKLPWPIRSGEHSQTAFALGLVLDWARTVGAAELARLVGQRSRDFYQRDAGWPLAFEPSGHDFLSPSLAEADLMRRLLDPKAFAAWLGGFLPAIPSTSSADWLLPAVTPDASDGKLAHLDGLNLSRAWMLEGIAGGLPPGDERCPALLAASESHRAAGLGAVSDTHYAGAHWLGSFAVYLITGRGLSVSPA